MRDESRLSFNTPTLIRSAYCTNPYSTGSKNSRNERTLFLVLGINLICPYKPVHWTLTLFHAASIRADRSKISGTGMLRNSSQQKCNPKFPLLRSIQSRPDRMQDSYSIFHLLVSMVLFRTSKHNRLKIAKYMRQKRNRDHFYFSLELFLFWHLICVQF